MVDDSFLVQLKGSFTFDVKKNDNYKNRGQANIKETSEPIYGTGEINGDDTLTYTSDSEIPVTDSFTYTVEVVEEDGSVSTETANVEVIVSDVEVHSIPSDFDWSNIPPEFGNSVWEIEHNFSFGGKSIILPENVTLIFKGGMLSNGSLNGNNTKIESNSNDQLFVALALTGT